MTGRNGLVDASNWGISDSEILAIVDDVADEDGWATTFAIRVQLGEDPWLPRGQGKGTTSGVGIRLGWLRRYGWVEKAPAPVKVESDEPEYGWRWSQSWRLTALGHALLEDPHLAATFENRLERLNPAQRLRVARELAEQGGGSPYRDALRRQWARSFRR